MRTLIIGDIHANFHALSALPDADNILCAGDVVTFGVEPNQCIDWLVARDASCVRGEEDDAVAHGTRHELPPSLAIAGGASRVWTRSVLTAERARWLAGLPPELELIVDRRRIAIVHAYPGDYNRYLKPTTEELDRLTRAFPHADFIVTSHTHRQDVWYHNGKIVLNPGSIGQNAVPGTVSYATYEHGHLSLHAAHYDVSEAVSRLRASSLPVDAQDVCVSELVHGSIRPYSRIPSATEYRSGERLAHV